MTEGDSKGTRTPQQKLALALAGAQLNYQELWLRCFALGGTIGMVELEAFIEGLMGLPPLQHNIIAHAINERLKELGPPVQAPYVSGSQEE